MSKGYAGRLLEVDLTNGSIRRVGLSSDLIESYIGGRGFASKLLWDGMTKGTKPLAAGNLLMFLTGPITGIQMGGHVCVSFKQPETATIGHAMVGGHWGPELKFAGYDGVVFEGRSDSPVYLYVNDDDVEIRSAGHLWGLGTQQTDMRIREELGDPFVQILCCGPAGENLVSTTGIAYPGGHGASRGGGGAVMGSKMLKAVAVRGTKGMNLERPAECLELVDSFTKRFLAMTGLRYRYRRFGTIAVAISKSDMCDLPVKNFREGEWADIDKIGGVRLERRNVISHSSCYSCPGGCFHKSVVRTGPYSGTVSTIDLDSSAMIGPNCLVKDLDGLMYLNALCDELGLDAEGIGDTISWAMECYEKKILTKEDLGGIDLTWGNVQAMIELIMDIVNRHGFGDILARGLKEASNIVGKGSEYFAMHCKGMGFGAHHPITPERGVQYAVGDRGGCHHYGTSLDEQNMRAWADSLTFCAWSWEAIGTDYINLLNAATGWDLADQDWDTIAERILILSRAFNIREGMNPLRDDVLPQRVHTDAFTYGKGKGKIYPREKFEKDRAEWYRARGCDERGIPTREHLRKLGLDFVVPELEKLGVCSE